MSLRQYLLNLIFFSQRLGQIRTQQQLNEGKLRTLEDNIRKLHCKSFFKRHILLVNPTNVFLIPEPQNLLEVTQTFVFTVVNSKSLTNSRGAYCRTDCVVAGIQLRISSGRA